MHIDIPSVILGMATVAALIGAFLVTLMFLRADGPMPPRLGFLGSLLNTIFSLLSALYLVTSYILPEDSMIYEQLASQRLVYLTGIIATVIGAVVLWRMAIRWTPPAPTV